jgi:hypothetical protein
MYDPDSPLLKEEQLNEFYPVNFHTMEDRTQAMRHTAVELVENAKMSVTP